MLHLRIHDSREAVNITLSYLLSHLDPVRCEPHVFKDTQLVVEDVTYIGKMLVCAYFVLTSQIAEEGELMQCPLVERRWHI